MGEPLQSHAFIDGNKRTAFAATPTFLAINAVETNASAGETYDFIANLHDTGAFRLDALVKWLREKTFCNGRWGVNPS
jgi:death-on-curing protein